MRRKKIKKKNQKIIAQEPHHWFQLIKDGDEAKLRNFPGSGHVNNWTNQNDRNLFISYFHQIRVCTKYLRSGAVNFGNIYCTFSMGHAEACGKLEDFRNTCWWISRDISKSTTYFLMRFGNRRKKICKDHTFKSEPNRTKHNLDIVF